MPDPIRSLQYLRKQIALAREELREKPSYDNALNLQRMEDLYREERESYSPQLIQKAA